MAGGPPPEWLLSEICREFNCLPSEALNEDWATVADILELRNYARAKQKVEEAEDESALSPDVVSLVFEVTKAAFDRTRARRERR